MQQNLEMESFGSPVWLCVRTQPKHEHIAAAGLTRRLGFEVFLPRLRLERATGRGVARVIEPLFPCYLFARCSLRECAEQIRYMTGVSSLVRFGNNIPTVPDLVVDELKQYFALEQTVAVEDPICSGAEVRVAEGALAGSRGIVVRLLPAKQRVQILLDFLGQTTVTEVDRKALTLENSCLADLVPMLAAASGRSVAAG